MDITLTPEQEHLIQDELASGRYESANQVVGEALRLLKQRVDTTEAEPDLLRAEIRAGLDQLARGEAKLYDSQSLKELFNQIKTRGRQRLARQRKQDAS